MSLLSTIKGLTDYDSSLVAETIGFLDPTPSFDWAMSGDIQCIRPEVGTTCGVAMTIEVDTSTRGNEWDFEPFYDLYRAAEKMDVPTVLVVKTVGSRPDHEVVMGDGLAKGLVTIGCAEIVTNGGVRDIEGMAGLPFGVFARGRTVHSCPWRFRNPNKPVEIGGITVNPGDVIHGNVQGVIKIPPACLEQLPERLAAMRAFEHRAHCIFRQPAMPIDQKRKMISDLLPEFGFKVPNWTKPKG